MQLEELGLDFSADAKKLLKALKESGGNGYGEFSGEKREKIDLEEVRHVAKLARLRMSDSEIGLYQKDLNAILDYVETLNELDTKDVSPMSHVLQECDLENVRMGMRVQAVWVDPDELSASVESIRYFKPIDEPDADFDSYKEHL